MKALEKRPGYHTAFPSRDFFDFDSFFKRPWPGFNTQNLPAINIAENDKSYEVEVIAPGFKKENFSLSVSDDILTISAETTSENKQEAKEYNRREYSYNSFTRSLQLPDNAKDDAISARYEDGVLKLSIPKSAHNVKASKEIKIS